MNVMQVVSSVRARGAGIVGCLAPHARLPVRDPSACRVRLERNPAGTLGRYP